MYNPYMYNPQMNYEKQAPIQNIIQTQTPYGTMFMAQMLKPNEKVEEMFVNNKTAFIDLYNKQLKIKEIDGNVTTYGLILPKDEKDLKIESLEKQIDDLKELIRHEHSNDDVSANNESTKQGSNSGKFNKTKSTNE